MSRQVFQPSTLRRAGAGIREATEDLTARTQAVLADCSDLTALGTDDTIGSLAQGMYAAVLERVQDTVGSLTRVAGQQSDALNVAAQLYAEVESTNAQLGGQAGV